MLLVFFFAASPPAKPRRATGAAAAAGRGTEPGRPPPPPRERALARVGARLMRVSRASERLVALPTAPATLLLSFFVCRWRVACPRAFMAAHAHAVSSSES